MGIYQRNLRNYDESVVLHNKSFGKDCVNCHTFLNNSPDVMALQVRGSLGGMLFVRNGAVTKLAMRPKAAYISWHPSGRLAAFSTNKVRQLFHGARAEPREVIDLDSALGIYMVDSNTVTMPASIAKPDRLETYPAWSPDGRHLYFCSAPILWSDRDQMPPDNFKQVRYDLMKISYDLETDQWGELETLLSAEETGMSIVQPRVSPDGRFLLFCMCEYGCFPIFHATSDLYLMDLTTGRFSRLPINSDQSDSWHSWSSNSRWIVFSSKRRDGQFARPYFSYIDETGKAHKPFVMPQKNPAFYDSFIKTYNLPELVKEPLWAGPRDFARAASGPAQEIASSAVTGATPPATTENASSSPYRPATEKPDVR